MTKSANPFGELRNFSFTMRYLLMPPMACSTRMRIGEISRFFAFSSSVRWCPLGFFFGWVIWTSGQVNPWKPGSRYKILPRGGIACCVSDTLVVDVTFTRRCEKREFAIGVDQDIVFHGVLLLFTTVIRLCASTSFGRWIGRSVPSWKKDLKPDPQPRFPQI